MSPANICEYAQGGINQGDTKAMRDVAWPVGCRGGMEGSKVNEKLRQAIDDLKHTKKLIRGQVLREFIIKNILFSGTKTLI